MPTASATGEYMTVDMGVPAGHKDQLDVFGDGAILDSTWATATNDIPGMMWKLRAASQKKYGMPVEHAWINSTTFNEIRTNNYMSMGTLSTGSFIIYKSMTKEPASNDYREQGAFDVVFNAMPYITFHVLDRALVVNSDDETTTSSTYFKMTIPDNVAAFTPSPSRDWLSVAEGSRTIRPKPSDAPRLEYGFHSYEVPRFGAGSAGIEMCLADSFLIYLLSRNALYIGTVIF